MDIAVLKYQKKLNKDFGTNLKEDGIWGKNTQAAYENYILKNKKSEKTITLKNSSLKDDNVLTDTKELLFPKHKNLISGDNSVTLKKDIKIPEEVKKYVDSRAYSNKPFATVSKVDNKIMLFNKEGNVFANDEVLLGKDKGDFRPQGYTKGLNSTPEGKYKFRPLTDEEADGMRKLKEGYNSNNFYYLQHENPSMRPIPAMLNGKLTLTEPALHGVPNHLRNVRDGLFDNGSLNDNRVSAGCINCKKKTLDKINFKTDKEKKDYELYVSSEKKQHGGGMYHPLLKSYCAQNGFDFQQVLSDYESEDENNQKYFIQHVMQSGGQVQSDQEESTEQEHNSQEDGAEQEIMVLVQEYAKITGEDPNQIIQMLQQASEQEQQQMMQQMVQAVQQAHGEEEQGESTQSVQEETQESEMQGSEMGMSQEQPMQHGGNSYPIAQDGINRGVNENFVDYERRILNEIERLKGGYFKKDIADNKRIAKEVENLRNTIKTESKYQTHSAAYFDGAPIKLSDTKETAPITQEKVVAGSPNKNLVINTKTSSYNLTPIDKISGRQYYKDDKGNRWATSEDGKNVTVVSKADNSKSSLTPIVDKTVKRNTEGKLDLTENPAIKIQLQAITMEKTNPELFNKIAQEAIKQGSAKDIAEVRRDLQDNKMGKTTELFKSYLDMPSTSNGTSKEPAPKGPQPTTPSPPGSKTAETNSNDKVAVGASDKKPFSFEDGIKLVNQVKSIGNLFGIGRGLKDYQVASELEALGDSYKRISPVRQQFTPKLITPSYINADPQIDQIRSNFLNATQNLNADDTRSVAQINQLLTNVNQQENQVLGQVQNQNQQIAAQTEANNVGILNDAQLKNNAYDKQFVNEVNQTTANQDAQRRGATASINEKIGENSSFYNNLDILKTFSPNFNVGSRGVYLDALASKPEFLNSAGLTKDALSNLSTEELKKVHDKAIIDEKIATTKLKNQKIEQNALKQFGGFKSKKYSF